MKTVKPEIDSATSRCGAAVYQRKVHTIQHSSVLAWTPKNIANTSVMAYYVKTEILSAKR